MTTVLFVCLHGAAKSLIAAEYFNRIATERGLDASAASAGVEPDASVPDAVVDALLRDGFDVRGHQPRRATAGAVAAAQHIVSIGCDLSSLLSDEVTREQWDDVPAVSDGYAEARDTIVARVTSMIDSGFVVRAPD